MKFTTLLLPVLFLATVSCYCPREKMKSVGNCSLHIECHRRITGVLIRNECLESSNDPVYIDVTLIDAVEPFDEQLDTKFLSLITTLKIFAHLPNTKLSILQYMSRLENLYLSGNHIENIEDTPFYSLISLEILDLSHNKLMDIKDLFSFELEPNKLRKLYLAHNKITYLSNDVFEELTSLVELDLSHNYITDLTYEPFSNLTSLEILKLNNNAIIDLNGAVNFLQNLKHLYLRGNQIQNIDEESLKIIIHLETFDVSLNQIENIKPVMFSRHWRHLGGHSICKILLSENHIISVPNGTSKDVTLRFVRQLSRFRNIDVLTELDLSKNQISNIEYNAFQSLIKLTSLDLSCNKIIDFVVDPNDLMFIRYLNLSTNYVLSLNFESFSRMNSLQSLDLSNNRLDTIPEKTFDHTHELKHVNMTFNAIGKLDGLHIHMFHPEGGTLDLSNNGLSRFKIAYGQGLRLTDLVLSSNNITDTSSIDLLFQNDLKSVNMSHNHIRELNANSLRLSLSLTDLDLSRNEIKSIGPSSFVRNGLLKTLYLSHNNLTSIEFGTFRGLNYLKNLDLSYNRIGVLDSKSFMDLKYMSVLSLKYNGLNYVYDQEWYGHKLDLKVYLDGNSLSCDWLATALKNYYNGYSKMYPIVLDKSFSGHSLDGVPCVGTPTDSQHLRNEPGVVMADDRLLIITKKILEAIREQNNYLKKYRYK